MGYKLISRKGAKRSLRRKGLVLIFKTQATLRVSSMRLPPFFAPLRELPGFSRKGAKRKLKAHRTVPNVEITSWYLVFF
jgi:hypothetical protein